MKAEITKIKKALGTVVELEGELKPFFDDNATTMVAPIRQFLENRLAQAEREELNSKLTPEIIQENIKKEEEATLEAAKRRMDERKKRREVAKADAEKAVIAQAKADKKAEKRTKGKVVEFKSPAPPAVTTDRPDGGADSGTGGTSGTDELTEEEKAAYAAGPPAPGGGADSGDGSGSASGADELTEEQKADLAAQGGESDENQGDELTEEEKALLAAESGSAQSTDSGSAQSTGTAQSEEVVKKTEKKSKGKASQVSTQEPLI